MATVRLNRKSQIFIPAAVRRALGLAPGDVLDVEIEGERMVVSRVCGMDALERLRSLRGTLPTGYGEEVLRERAHWEGSPRHQ